MHTDEKLERREFLEKAGIAAAASALACGGFHVPQLSASGAGMAEPCDANVAIPKKILIAYASRAGSTAEVAEAIGQVLRGGGMPVDVLPAGQVASTNTYRAVIIGSAIRMGRWLPEAARLVEKNQAPLTGIPTAFFSVCLTMQKDTPENRRTVEDYMKPVVQKLRPLTIGLFGGKMDYSRLGFLDRLIVSKMKKIPEGDYRDWSAIRSWAAKFQPA